MGSTFTGYSCGAEAEARPPAIHPVRTAETVISQDLVYAAGRQSNNRLDVYSPRVGSLHPVVIFFHGGKFSSGDKTSSVFNKPWAFTSRGFVLVSVDYRLSPEVKYPLHVQDVAASIAWVRKNIKRYGGDPQSLFVMGHSAGAQLAALVATDPQFLANYGLTPATLNGAILLDGGTYNLVATARSSSRHDLLLSVFGRDSRIWWQASPIKHVKAGHGIPPFLVIYIPNRVDATAQALAFANALKKSSVQTTVVAVTGKTHAELNEELGLPNDRPTQAVFQFLSQQSKSKDQSVVSRAN
ncbi:MAG TPA: alpha/beta hydrolase [Drouetiella sp.]|jgi:arylformamidase